MSGQCASTLKVSERFYEGLFFYRHPKVLLKPDSLTQHRTPPNRSTTNVAVDRNAPAARKEHNPEGHNTFYLWASDYLKHEHMNVALPLRTP